MVTDGMMRLSRKTSQSSGLGWKRMSNNQKSVVGYQGLSIEGGKSMLRKGMSKIWK
jgi:hypothetical protein